MTDWEKILWAGLIGVMIVLLIPQTKALLQQSKEAKAEDWSAIVLPLLLVVGFVAILIMLVR